MNKIPFLYRILATLVIFTGFFASCDIASMSKTKTEANRTTTSARALVNTGFDSGISGWIFALSQGGVATAVSQPKAGYSGQVVAVAVTNPGASPFAVQLYQAQPLTIGANYTITFKASADADRTIALALQQNISPWTTHWSQYSIALTTTPTECGPFSFTSTVADANAVFKFLLGSSSSTVYIDDVVINDSSVVTTTTTTTTTLPPNLVLNPTFDANTTGWTFALSGSGAATLSPVTQSGYAGKAAKATITAAGTSDYHVQMYQSVPIVAGKTYTITFKASADAARTLSINFQKNVSPWTINWAQYTINIGTAPAQYGPYTFASTLTDSSTVFKFLLGNSTTAAYIDDVVIISTDTVSATTTTTTGTTSTTTSTTITTTTVPSVTLSSGPFNGFGNTFPGYGSNVSVGRSVYVDAGAASNGNGSSGSPYKSLQSASDASIAGDTIYMRGTFNYNGSGDLLRITRNGNPSNPITYTKWPGYSVTLKLNLTGTGTASRTGWGAIRINANYIVIDGIAAIGANNDPGMDLARGEAVYAYFQSVQASNGAMNWAYVASTNSNGIFFDDQTNASQHHVTIKNCDVSLFAGAGIGGSKGDYIVIDNNKSYNNSWYTLYACSGISPIYSQNSDSYTGYKTIISNNITYGNKTLVKWAHTSDYSDGNGIIVDINTTAGGNNVNYNGRTLVINNVSYNNGGSGLHSVRAAKVDFIGNTAYKNATRSGYQDTYPNLGAMNHSDDNNFYNNIVVAEAGKPSFDIYASTFVSDYNVYFGGTAVRAANKGVHDITVDPQLAGPFSNLNGNIKDSFKLNLPSSPAYNGGVRLNGFAIPSDIWGTSRPSGSRMEMGAYEAP